MGTRNVGSYWGFVLLAAGALGCTSTKDRCETACDWTKDCTGVPVNCSDSEIDSCVDEYEKQSDGCQDAFDEFVDCLDDHDNKCSDVEKECLEEASKYVDKCS